MARRTTVLQLAVAMACLLMPFDTASAASSDPVGLLSLVEASGAAQGGAWSVLTSAPLGAGLCGTSNPSTATAAADGPYLLLVDDANTFAVLSGPTPHVVANGTFTVPSSPSQGVGWKSGAVADVTGDGAADLILLRHDGGTAGGDLIVLSFTAGCQSLVTRTATSLKPPACASPPCSSLADLAVGHVPGVNATAVAVVAWSTPAALSATAAPLTMVSFQKGTAVAQQASRLCIPPSTSGTVSSVALGEVGVTTPAPFDASVTAAAQLEAATQDTLAAPAMTNLVVTTTEEVILLRINGSAVGPACAVQATGAAPFTDASVTTTAISSLTADGVPRVVIVTDAETGDNMFMLGDNSTAALQVQVSERVDVDGHSAMAATVVAWLSNVDLLPGETQLVVLRAPPKSEYVFPVRLLVFGRSLWYLNRAAGFEGSRSMYGLDDAMTYPLQNNQVVNGLTITNANTYSYIVCDVAGDPSLDDYSQMITALNATAHLPIRGRQVRFWVTLLPPTESIRSKCVVPPDDPRTEFNETAQFDPTLGYSDYVGWGRVMGLLGRQFPHLVALQIDDMSHDIQPPAGIFTPDVVARMTSAMRAQTPTLSLISTMYYNSGGEGPSHFVWNLWPDFSMVVDTVLFYFRNQKQGAGPCLPLPCPWGPDMHERAGGCLAGSCADSTVQNAPGEIADIAGGMPAGRRIQVGFYATGHSSLGTPSPRYVRQMLTTILGQHALVGGVTFYRFHVPKVPCNTAAGLVDEGCIAAEVFANV